MKLKITGYSTALFSTWIFIEELGILFDAGDGVASGLGQKGGKIKHVFVSHADRDHLSGLLQFTQLNAREGFPIIYYPEDCGSFPALKSFTEKFDPHSKGSIWKPIQSQDHVAIKKDRVVEAIRNNHVSAAEGIHKSLSYKVFDIKHKLKNEFSNYSGKEIKEIVSKHGREHITEEIKTNTISFSGDTPVEDYERWNDSEILIHEATFLGNEQDKQIEAHGNKHSTLYEVLEMVANINVGTLVLSHFSSRYSHPLIDQEIRKLCKKFNIQIPIYRILPGQIHRDLLKEEPIN